MIMIIMKLIIVTIVFMINVMLIIITMIVNYIHSNSSLYNIRRNDNPHQNKHDVYNNR